jgi:3-oxoacyl-[acyl-carrier protein] reductase
MAAEQAFAGRVALVTGGSGGIGGAICQALAREGATVAVGYGSGRDAAHRLAAELGGRAQAFGADLADPAEPERLVAEVEAVLGPVDVLVANHGLGRAAEWETLSAADFDEVMAVNARAPFLLAQRALPGMRARGFGRVLFVSSTAALRGGVLAPDYAASKAALHGLAYFLAQRVARDGVTVNVIAPGYVETAMLPGDPAELGASVPAGRVGRPDEVADLALAILRNGFVTAKVIGIDGGSYPR